MVDLPLTTTAGSQTVIEGTTVETLKTSLRGELLRAGDAAYDEARKVWNGMIDKRPASSPAALGSPMSSAQLISPAPITPGISAWWRP